MKESEYWDVFYQTGKVDDYLHYACTCEMVKDQNKEERQKDGRNSNGYGARHVANQ